MQSLDSLDLYAEYLLPGEFGAYELLLKEQGNGEEKIRALIQLYNVIYLPTESFDDLIRFSTIMDRDESRFITTKMVIHGLLRLNDELINLQSKELRKADLDIRIVQFFSQHNMVADMSFYNDVYQQYPADFFLERDTTKFMPKEIYAFGSKNENYEPFGNIEELLSDKQLKTLIQEKYVLYIDDQRDRNRIIQILHQIVPSIKEEIALL
ncbi:MAG: hypothetical protein HRT61_10000 [Ekhidna sp.]|nr:hypothetical protein [Ekhidna sp.]